MGLSNLVNRESKGDSGKICHSIADNFFLCVGILQTFFPIVLYVLYISFSHTNGIQVISLKLPKN